MLSTDKIGWVILGLLTLIMNASQAKVEVNGLISDNMVLQRDVPVVIWGKADEGEKVTVAFDGQSKSAVAAQGKWQVTLDPLSASADPQAMKITGQNEITLQNVLVGEVWLASGQSNMSFSLKGSYTSATAIPQANDPLLRLFTVSKRTSGELESTLADGHWEPCTSDNAPAFSAVAYFFGRELRAKLNCPVALIHSSWGGTPAQSWTSMEALRQDPPFPNYVAQWDQAVKEHEEVVAHPERLTDYEESLKTWQKEVQPAFEEAMKTYNQDVAAGKTVAKPKPTSPEPSNPDPMGQPSPSSRPKTPSVLFNAMIAPLIPYTLKGVIWYQGEANAGAALEYRTLFPRLIQDWRKRWNQGDFPFLFVQLASWAHGPQTTSDQHDFPWLREAQLMTLSLPNTGMAVTVDIGNPKNVHPADKLDVGLRLALQARKVAYREELQASGPLYQSKTIEGNSVRLTFTEIGGGLIIGEAPWRADGVEPIPTNKLAGFVIAGQDHQWHPADAVIKGTEVVVSSAEVPQPLAVRYAWDNAPRANLYNKDGLPASPFRTDDWPKDQAVSATQKTE